MPNASTKDLSQDVTSPIIGWDDSVTDQKCCRAAMIGDNSHGSVDRKILPVVSAGNFRRQQDQGL
jgi:hypothetical protein